MQEQKNIINRLNKKFTAHCVVKNEERWIWFSVKSVIDFMEKVFIYDTGSTDKTVDIIKQLQCEYKDKIVFKQLKGIRDEDFWKIRQEQVDNTETDWFLILDGDEIWYRESIEELVSIANSCECDMIATRFYNCVGDVFHFKNYDAEHYKIKNETGSLTIRAYSKRIKGIHCKNKYGIEGFFDSDNVSVQQNSERIFIQQGYFLHTSYTQRSSSVYKDREIEYRKKKLFSKYDYIAGKDFKYPEVFYFQRPANIYNPFSKINFLRKTIFILSGLKANFFNLKKANDGIK
jgi:glycosyltransferase involved in cell wall biosynthesis